MEVTIKSKVTGKSYTGENYADLVAQCEKDDELFLANKEEEKEVSNTTVSKKSFAKLVQAADKDLEEAEENYEKVKSMVTEKAKADNDKLVEMCKKAQDDYNEALKAISDERKRMIAAAEEELKPADAALRDARKKRLEAVANFNKRYGPYQYQEFYSGEDAVKEFNKVKKQFDDHFKTMFSDNIFRPFLNIW